MKTPYSEEQVLYLREIVSSGLKVLKNVGKSVNYEEMCQDMLDSIPSSIYAPEWSHYWNYWKSRFETIGSKTKRKKVFEDCLLDLKNKGLLPHKAEGLTAYFSLLVEEIIANSTNED